PATPANPAAGAAANPWPEIGSISARARQLGLSVPRMSLGLTGGTAYNDTMPAVVDLIDHLKGSAASSNASPDDVNALLKRASTLLLGINDAEHSPRHAGDVGEQGAATQYMFDSLKDEYLRLFNNCVISSAHRAQVGWYIGKLTDTDYDQSYDSVEDSICVP